MAIYSSCWKAFQYEVAIEELFYGHPLSPLDNQLSVSLGTNTVSPKSLTHNRGFIGLAPHTADSAGEVPPPLDHWTKNELQRTRLERLFPLCQTLEAVPAHCGVALLRVLLGDIYRSNTDLPYAALKGEGPPGRLCRSQKLEVLCEDVATKKSFPAPHTFRRARELLTSKGRDVKEVLVQGFLSEKLSFFPNIKFRDVRGGHKLFWDCKSFIVLESEGQPHQLSRVASAILQVCTEVERRSLCYSRNMEKYREHGMPWMGKVLERLPPRMCGQLHINVLKFVSSISMIMNGDYVDFQDLRTLLDDISPHVNQALLQKGHVLSNFSLPKVFNMTIWKLHEDIKHKVEAPPKVKFVAKQQTEVRDEQPFEDVQEVPHQDGVKPLEMSKAMTYAASDKWQR